MATIQVDGDSFDLVADSVVQQSDWIVQTSPEHQGFFESIKGEEKTFDLDDDQRFTMKGYVLETSVHTHNTAKQNTPQLQVQIRRAGL
ncbi:MAG: hypothetical protein IPM23_21875 [Candidatus Melainabacteria bacterium]|nr:hypothetical protein [Candidatus Melainabacteria bacterium]